MKCTAGPSYAAAFLFSCFGLCFSHHTVHMVYNRINDVQLHKSIEFNVIQSSVGYARQLYPCVTLFSACCAKLMFLVKQQRKCVDEAAAESLSHLMWRENDCQPLFETKVCQVALLKIFLAIQLLKYLSSYFTSPGCLLG